MAQVAPSERNCEACGKPIVPKRYASGNMEPPSQLVVRRFCDMRCKAAGETKPAAEISDRVCGLRAGRVVPAGPCSSCGAANGRDVHHRSGDRRDNRPENLVRLCRACHKLAHSDRPRRCLHCGAPHLARGYCARCYERFVRRAPVAVDGQYLLFRSGTEV